MADNDFNKNMRLLSANDFKYLKKNSKILNNKFYRIFYKPSHLKSSSYSRLGIAVSKKVGKAHDRNLCKRIIRESFRTSNIKTAGFDFLITISPRLFKNLKSSDEVKALLADELNTTFNDVSIW